MSTSQALLGLLRAKSIAFIGGREAEEAIRQCEKLDFRGDIWPVNAKRDKMEGHACYKHLEDLPHAPDAAFIAIPVRPTIEAVAFLSKMGAGGAVCYASGFKEVSGGDVLQKELVRAAGDMPIIGPNCYGVLNYLEGAALWPDQHGGDKVEKGVAIITQSGNIGLNLSMQRRSLDIAYLISLGNQAAIGIEQCLEALLGDDRVTAIGLHIEGLSDLAAFESAAKKAADAGIPIVALKAGRSEAAARIALSHTASLTGEDGLFDAFFKRLGIARANSIPTFLESLKVLSIIGPLQGNNIVSMSCSGGEASLIADLSKDMPLEFTDFADDHKEDIRKTLNEYVSVSNPLDYHTFIWGDEERMTDCFTAVMKGPQDLTALILDFPRSDRCEPRDWFTACRTLVAASQATGNNAAVIATLAECLDEEAGRYLAANGVMPFYGMEEALAAIEAAISVGKYYAHPAPPPLIKPDVSEGDAPAMDEWRSKRLLSSLGIPVPEGALVRSATEAVSAAESLGYPVAIKVVSADMAHKTEVGGVKLNLIDADAVNAAAEHMLTLADTVLVESMVKDSVAELIVGVDRDPQFGPFLVVGFGGVLVELIGDSQSLLLPTDRHYVADALASLKTAALLNGYRGLPKGDVEALIDAILAVARFVEENADSIEEIDINPLMVRPEGNGVMAVDAYIRMRKGGSHDG